MIFLFNFVFLIYKSITNMENGMVQPSACALRLFLVLLNCREPGLLDIIKSYMFIYTRQFNNYNYMAQCYFNIPLTVAENTVINWVYSISEECDLKEQISIFHRFINGNLKSLFLKVCKETIEERTSTTYYEPMNRLELTKVKDLLGIYYIMTTNQMIKNIDFMYIYNITLQTSRINQNLNNTNYLTQNGIFEHSTEYPKYTKSLKESVTKTIASLNEIVGQIEYTEKNYYMNYEREIMEKIEDLKHMLM